MKSRSRSCWKPLAIGALAACIPACNTLVHKSDAGVIVAKRAEIRSSTAVVAADLLEVNRGDGVEVLDSTNVQDERWLLVRARNEDNTEGWIEARNVLPDSVLNQSQKLAEKDKDTPAQATGQLRASSNLRLSPDRNGNENIILKLDTGSKFEIVAWQRSPKPKTTESTESDDAPKSGAAQQKPQSRRESDTPKEPEEANELWYRVRLGSDACPAPEGWVYGKQVELTVPSDIIFYRTGREFVAWQRLDDDPSKNNSSSAGATPGVESKPGSWVILEKGSSSDPKKANEPDFDRIYVLGYDKSRQEHYTAYRSPDLRGFLPMRVEIQGETKSFIIKVQDANGQMVDAKYNVTRTDKGTLKVSPESDPNKERGKR